MNRRAATLVASLALAASATDETIQDVPEPDDPASGIEVQLTAGEFEDAASASDETIQEALEPEDPASRIEVQLTAGEFADAATAAEALVEEVEETSGRYGLVLKRPLTLLGDALLGMGDGPGALAAYDRALHVARVNRGLFDPDQVDVVYREAVVHATMGDRVAADARHSYAFSVLLRAYGREDARLVPGLFTLAEWHQENHRVFSARRLFDRVVTIAASQFPSGDPRMIRALRGVAATFRDERFPRNVSATRNRAAMASYRDTNRNRAVDVNNFAPGERALITVINLQQENPDSTNVDIADGMLELADWYLLFEKYERAFALYERVWQLLEEDTARRDATFAAPTPLYLPFPPNPKLPSDVRREPQTGIVELALAVSDRGKVEELDTVRSEPAGLMDFRLRKLVRRARYRPAFVDAEPVAAAEVPVEYRFVYVPEEADET